MLFSGSSLLLALSLVLCVSARPAEKKRWGGSWMGGESHSSFRPTPGPASFAEFGKRYSLQQNVCDLSSAVANMNLGAGKSPNQNRFNDNTN